ncbi:MAG: glycoside hydrolase family 3 C-terminal domain-containing protein [Clostridia bacterium]|nr:glycoside hydrolase family 3 C-terminal domain-containing protein [Clostridia bacterium]
MKVVLSFISKLLLVIFVILYGVVNVGGQIAAANASVISKFLGQDGFNMVKDETLGADEELDTEYFKSEYSSVSDLKANGEMLTQLVMEEGAVLLKNDNGALPLSSTDKISLFSASSVSPIFSGYREHNDKSSGTTNLLDGFTAAGLDVNRELYNWYKSSNYGRQYINGPGLYAIVNINDAPWSAIPDSAKFADGYNTAVFVLSRIGGEGTDNQMFDNGESNNSRGYEWDGYNGNYLALSEDERSVLQGLKAAKDAGQYDKIIVLCNFTNQVMLDFVDDPAYGVDAVLYSGGLGSKGSVAIANILKGTVNPSGKLSDTFWKNHYLNPVHANYGQYKLDTSKIGDYYAYSSYIYFDTNGKEVSTSAGNQNGYVVYQEGIYVGYRYTETRYEDKVMGTGNAGNFNYSAAVSYPFGYGLSYTSFEYSDYSVIYNAETDSYDISVKVKNIGSVAGKESVQIFLQKPYTEYDKQMGVEAAAVELVAYDKTDLLEPGAEQTLNMSVERRDFAKYDSYGHKTYILEEGEYYLAAGKNAHDAVNNILAAKGFSTADGMDEAGNANLTALVGFADSENDKRITSDDLLLYSTAKVNVYSDKDADGNLVGKLITNQFDNADPKIFDGGVNYGENALGGAWTYVTRNNWADTVKYAVAVDEATGYVSSYDRLNNFVRLVKTDAIKAGLDFDILDEAISDVAYPTFESTETAWQLIDLRVDENGNPIAYNDPRWDELLDQLSWDDYVAILAGGLYNTPGLSSISAPASNTYDSDLGVISKYNMYPSGLATKLNDPDKNTSPATYVDNGIVAATRNLDLIYEYGIQWGEDCLWAGFNGLYGAGANIHRSPYLGRSYGYISEDGFLSGMTLAKMNLGMETKGAYMLAKHCVLNEQETNRCGAASWANEQSIREIYVKVFEVAIEEGSLQGVMTSLNRIGTTPAPHHTFLNEVLRYEFGMTGYNVTDSGMPYMNTANCVWAGNDLPINGVSHTVPDIPETGYGHLAQAARDCVHNVLYTVVNSSAMNGFSSDMRVVRFQPEWEYFLGVATDIINVAIIPVVVFYIAIEIWVGIRRRFF